MPTYDYRCPRCSLEFEVTRPFSRANEPAFCPNDKVEAERLFRMPMTFVKGGTRAVEDASTTPPDAHGHDHGPGGHSHGPGGHTHGPI